MRGRGRFAQTVTVAALASLLVCCPALAVPRPGSLDMRFPFPPTGGLTTGLAVDRDGRVLVAATGSLGDRSTPSVVLAYRPDGYLDPSFGDRGIARVPPSIGDEPPYIGGMALQPDGRVVVAGVTCCYRVTLERLTSEGSLDPSFGSGGIVTGGDESPLAPTVTDVIVQPDGAIVVAAGDYSGSGAIIVERHLTDGSPDQRFGSGGRVIVPKAAGAPGQNPKLALHPDGSVLVATSVATSVVRLLADGRPDPSFGYGPAMTAVTIREGAAVSAPDATLVVDRAGRLRLTGDIQLRPGGKPRFAVAGLTAEGKLDPTFGDDGLAVGPAGFAYDAVVDRHGSILVGGSTYSEDIYGQPIDTAFGIARFLASGRVDRSFGVRGLAQVPPDRNNNYNDAPPADQLALDRDIGRILGAGSHSDRGVPTGGPELLRLHNSYDRAPPVIDVTVRCVRGRAVARVRIRDLSALDRVTVRARARRLLTTERKRFRVSLPSRARRLRVSARDLAGNTRQRRLRLPSCARR